MTFGSKLREGRKVKTTRRFKLWEGQRFKTTFGSTLWEGRKVKTTRRFKLWEGQRFKTTPGSTLWEMYVPGHCQRAGFVPREDEHFSWGIRV